MALTSDCSESLIMVTNSEGDIEDPVIDKLGDGIIL